jgi:hypothetical protein
MLETFKAILNSAEVLMQIVECCCGACALDASKK